jgi:hypothetical protein
VTHDHDEDEDEDEDATASDDGVRGENGSWRTAMTTSRASLDFCTTYVISIPYPLIVSAYNSTIRIIQEL